MARFVTFQDPDGDPVMVNVDHIAKVWPCPGDDEKNSCFVSVVGSSIAETVVGSFQDVCRTIKDDQVIRKL